MNPWASARRIGAARGQEGQAPNGPNALPLGSNAGRAELCGRRVQVQCPRARSKEVKEGLLPSFDAFRRTDPVLSKNTNELKTGAPGRFDRHRPMASPSSGACRRQCRRFGFPVRAGKTPFSNEVPRSRAETWIQARAAHGPERASRLRRGSPGLDSGPLGRPLFRRCTALSATRSPSCAKTRPFETDHNISSLVSVFATGSRAVLRLPTQLLPVGKTPSSNGMPRSRAETWIQARAAPGPERASRLRHSSPGLDSGPLGWPLFRRCTALSAARSPPLAQTWHSKIAIRDQYRK